MSLASARREFEAQVEELFSNSSRAVPSQNFQPSACSRQRSDPNLSPGNIPAQLIEDLVTRDSDHFETGNVRRLKKLYEERLQKQELDYTSWLNSKDYEIKQLQKQLGQLNNLLLSKERSSQPLVPETNPRGSDEDVGELYYKVQASQELSVSNHKIKLLEVEKQTLKMKLETSETLVKELQVKLNDAEDERNAAIVAVSQMTKSCAELKSSMTAALEKVDKQGQTILKQSEDLNVLKSVEKQHLELVIKNQELHDDHEETIKRLDEALCQLKTASDKISELSQDASMLVVLEQEEEAKSLRQDELSMCNVIATKNELNCKLSPVSPADETTHSLRTEENERITQIKEFEEELRWLTLEKAADLEAIKRKHSEVLKWDQNGNSKIHNRLYELSRDMVKNEELLSQLEAMQANCHKLKLNAGLNLNPDQTSRKTDDKKLHEHKDNVIPERESTNEEVDGEFQFPHFQCQYTEEIPGAESSTQTEIDMDAVYLRTIMFKFLTNTDAHVARQLVQIVSSVLQLSEAEDQLLLKSLRVKGWVS